MRKALRGLRPLVWACVVASGGCGDGPTEPALPRLELLVAGGDAQYGTPGQRLATPLQALVRRADTQAPQSGVAVTWTVEQGDASLLSTPVTTTDAQGLASATLQLGAAAGTVTLRAEVRDQTTARATFQAFIVDRPQLTQVTPTDARGGDTVTVRGAGFSPNATQNVVLFSGIRGEVVSGSASELRVRVPPCLPPRSVSLTVQLGGLVSSALSLAVTDGGSGTPLEEGVPLDVDVTSNATCLRLPGGRRYLVVAQSAGTVGAAKYGFALRGLVSSPAPAAHATGAAEPARVIPGDAAWHFEETLRIAEGRLVRTGAAGPALAPARAPQAVVPAVGSQRAFKVLNVNGGFDDVQATARWVSDQAVLYVDQRAPGGGFTEAELKAFAATFDSVIHPTVTGAFGQPSDLDANQRVAILFTPTVNSLTKPGAEGFIGGFFYGLDLLDREGSNKGEIFYALVPDSLGTFSDARARHLVLRVTPAILAHEFQHMVHFNERVLKLGASGTEALWLSEGLAQMAEELVALAYLSRGDAAAVEEYRAGNRTRGRRYLSDPGAVSLIVATGQGSLAERGAGWLHTLYLWDRWGGNTLLGRLTQSTLTGTANVAAATGRGWPDLLADWAAAVYLEGQGGRPYPLAYPQVDLRALLSPPTAYPLSPETLGTADFSRTGSLWSSSARHYIVIPPPSGFVALQLGGEAGGNAPAEAGLRLRVVPLF